MNNNRLGLAGAALLVGGLFAPAFTVPLRGSINFITSSPVLVSMSLVVLGCVAVFACARAEVGRLNWLGAGALAILAAQFGLVQYRFSQIQARFEESIAGNPFADRARDSFSSVQTEWGWLLLALGAGLLIYASVNERKAQESGEAPRDAKLDKAYGLIAGLASLAGLGMVGITHLNSTDTSSHDVTAAAAEDVADDLAADAEADAFDQEKQQYISDNMEVYELRARYMDSLLDGRVPGVTFKVRNNGDRTLDRVEVTIEFLDANGNPIAEEVYNPVIVSSYGGDTPLRPGYIWQNERGRFYSASAVPSEWQSGNARARVSDIEFSPEE